MEVLEVRPAHSDDFPAVVAQRLVPEHPAPFLRLDLGLRGAEFGQPVELEDDFQIDYGDIRVVRAATKADLMLGDDGQGTDGEHHPQERRLSGILTARVSGAEDARAPTRAPTGRAGVQDLRETGLYQRLLLPGALLRMAMQASTKAGNCSSPMTTRSRAS